MKAHSIFRLPSAYAEAIRVDGFFDRHFWPMVERGDCWRWRGSLYMSGYGRFDIGRAAQLPSLRLRTHRLSYELMRGAIPPGRIVCHACDNRICCNPDHLWLGSNSDNLADMRRKGRGFTPRPSFVRGSAHGRSKLNEREAVMIRRRYTEGATLAALAVEYGVGVSTVSRVVNRLNWTHV